MKYRIIIGPDKDYPFRIERKERDSFWCPWEYVNMEKTMVEAETKMREDMRKMRECQKLPRKGTVLKEFDESDLIVDRLKGV